MSVEWRSFSDDEERRGAMVGCLTNVRLVGVRFVSDNMKAHYNQNDANHSYVMVSRASHEGEPAFLIHVTHSRSALYNGDGYIIVSSYFALKNKQVHNDVVLYEKDKRVFDSLIGAS